MISPSFYDKSKAAEVYTSTVKHFLKKDASVVLEKYAYVIQEGETIYSIALKIFGEQLAYKWTIICDCNVLKDPMDWKTGETIYLPSVILNDPDLRAANYVNASSNTAGIRY